MVLFSCSGHQNEPTERPGTEPAINPELTDRSTRISGSPLTLRYDDGGILFSRDSHGIISAVRLSDESRFEFDPAGPELKINGVTVNLAGASLVQEKESTLWYRLDLTGSAAPVYIVIPAGL